MRLFSIDDEDKFVEYVERDFGIDHREMILENWLDNNPQAILEDSGLLIIGRQVATNLGSYIDLLGVDRNGNVAVIELKRDRTPRDTLAQALEYASFVEMLDYGQLDSIFHTYTIEEGGPLAQYHRTYFELSDDEAVVFNRDQRIVIIGQDITPEIRQTSTFLRQKGIQVTCIEFGFFKTADGARLMSSDIVVGKEPVKPTHVSSAAAAYTNHTQFMSELDDFGKPVFERLFDFAKAKNLRIGWGTKGFSMRAELATGQVVLIYGFPLDSVYKQSVYTAFVSPGGLSSGKVEIPEDVTQSLLADARSTGLFQTAGGEIKCVINRPFTENEIDSLIIWCQKLLDTVLAYGSAESSD